MPWSNGEQVDVDVSRIEVGGITTTSTQRVRVEAEALDMEPGDSVVIEGKLRAARREDPFAARLQARSVEVAGEASGPQDQANRVHTALMSRMDGMPAHARGLIPGVAVGDDSLLPDDDVDTMRMMGLSHLTAVSGAHVSLLMAGVIAAIGLRRRVITGIAVALSVGGLIVLVGPQASVLRAGYMGIPMAVALALRRPSSAMPLLCLVVMWVSLSDPVLATSLGFRLSAVATGAIIVFGYRLRDAMKHVVPSTVAELLAVPLIAGLATGPFLSGIQDVSSVWTVLANAAVAPVVAPLTVSGLGAAGASAYAPALAGPVLAVAQLCTWWIDAVARFFAQLPGSGVPLAVAIGANLLVLVALIVWVKRRSGRGAEPRARTHHVPVRELTNRLGAMAAHGHSSSARRVRSVGGDPRRTSRRKTLNGWFLVILSALALVLASLVSAPRLTGARGIPDDWVAIQCDVGQGSAFLARRGSDTILIDVGPREADIARCLREAKVDHLDLLILTHVHSDHIGGLDQLLDAVSVDDVWLGPNQLPDANANFVHKELAAHGLKATVPAPGTVHNGWLRTISPTHPVMTEESVNDDSLVIELTASHGQDKLRVVVLSDVGALVQNQLDATEPTDVVVVAHHGAKDQSQALANRLAPRLALVSVAKDNDFGHPTTEARRTWGDWLTTAECGPIALTPTEVWSRCG